MIRNASAFLLTTLGLLVAGCQPPSETNTGAGTLDATGYARVHAESAGDNHHYYVDVDLRDAPAGSYALVFSVTEPRERAVVTLQDPALRCASAHGKSCELPGKTGEIVALASIGPGGAGVLRATFDVGSGGWFQVLRVDVPQTSAVAAKKPTILVRVVSEALARDEEPHRFAIHTS